MTTSCYRTEDLGTIAKLREGDPHLRHLSECARCRALLALYRKSADPNLLPPAARLDDARAVLARRLEDGIRGATPHPISPRPAEPGFWQSLRETLFRQRLIPAWGAAVLAVLIIAVWQVGQSPEPPPSPPALRGGGLSETPVAAAPERLANGLYLLAWTPVAEAESYQVVFLLPGLDELTRINAADLTRLEIDPQALPLPTDPPPGLFWQVIALRGGNQIAASDMQTLTLRDHE
jgi:hypothetical protein